ncbi:MAG TPA: lysophospholipid acyltransferase family protein [Pyrinomonadaceae bacterium]|nr:lysophospholipid acyltransferase family protein [Pyrinomonadaceae bacterium]
MNAKATFAREKPATRAPVVFPQWAFDAMRPVIRTFSQLCWKLKLYGTENIPSEGGLIIASNHQTYFDPFWISIPVNRPCRYLAWDGAFHWPFVGKAMGLFGAWPLQVEGSDPAAIRRSIQWLRGGGVLVIFPEGARSTTDGAMSRFKAGAARLALEVNVPILPVTIRGANRVWPRNQQLPRLAPVEIIYHPPHSLEPLPDEETRGCARRETETLAQTIGSAL